MTDTLDREVGRPRQWTRALMVVLIAALALAVGWLLLLTE